MQNGLLLSLEPLKVEIAGARGERRTSSDFIVDGAVLTLREDL